MRKASSSVIMMLSLSLLFVGCKQTGTRDIYADYQPVSIELKFTGLTGSEESVLPGSKAQFDVVVKGDDGKHYSLNNGGLKRKDLILATKNITLLKEDKEIQFDASITDGAKYSISAKYAGHEKKIGTTKNFIPDFAALRGPEPKDVKRLFFSIDRTSTDGELVPGRSYPLSVTVTDNLREYKTGEKYPALPLNQLKIMASGMEFDPDKMTLTGSTNKELLDKRKYKVEVSYTGRQDLTQEEVMAPDFTLIEGPSPISIKKVNIIGGLREFDAVIPGSEIRVELQVEDKNGRIYRTDREFPKIPRRKVGVWGKNLEYDKNTGLLKFSGELLKMLGNQYEVTVWYRGRKSKKKKIRISPDFVSGLPLMKQKELIFRGQKGQDGRHGKSAKGIYKAAVKLNAGKDKKIKAFNGGDGENGSDGADGLNGPDITIRAQEVNSLDETKRLILMEVTAQGEPAKYYLRSWDEPALRVASYGGNGGNGGSGGDGASGDESNYYDDDDEDAIETEAPLYYGGNGGRGGDGGNGGSITLLISKKELAKAFVLKSREGKGGDKGAGGAGGSSSGKQEIAVDQPPADSAQAKPGSGKAGADGVRGSKGKMSVSIDKSTNEIAQRAPKEISDWVRYSSTP